MAAEPERFDCRTCEVRRQVESLWIVNAEAWRCYHTLRQRLVQDWHLAPWVLSWWGPSEDRADLLARLNVLHSILCPAEQTDGRP